MRDPTVEDPVLNRALEGIRLSGAFFLRAQYTEGWAYQSPPPDQLCGLLRPDRQRLVLFHLVATGSCWIRLPDGDRHTAEAGDVIVLPYGDQHCMGGREECALTPIGDLLEPPPWRRFPVIRHGGGGPRTDVVCGYLEADDPLFDPRLAALPPVFVVRPTGPVAAWVQASVAYAMEVSRPGARPDPVRTRLPELLLVEVLRLHLATAPAADHGWLAALRDPVLAPTLARLHEMPHRKWTVDELAAAAAVSRSALDERFRQALGRPPIRYLTEWRMHVARDLLGSTALPVVAIARRVGYDSEEAFSRAFKRILGVPPTVWRTGGTEPGDVSP